ncbi:MAG: Hsp20/alpha crystallin family protein [Chloroflexi bacterium]|nr:Hsp20/alpha crystallin family protein [Chloroflexota bacterium]
MVLDLWRPGAMARPFQLLEEAERLLESERPFRTVWYTRPRDGMGWTPAIDMYEKEDSFIVRAELPGVKKEDVEITVMGDTLTMKGERKPPEGIKEQEYQCTEICYGKFSRSLTLPTAVDTEKIEATYENGVLEITLPKVKEATPAKVQIKSK